MVTALPQPGGLKGTSLKGGDTPLGSLVDSILGSRPLNKQPLLIADSLEEELLSLGWPTGLRIGGEPALAHRFGVGRDVLREVVRLLEGRNHARMRRGPGGGLEIVRPDLQDLIGRLFGYAYVAGIDRVQALETWIILQAAAVRALSARHSYDWSGLTARLEEKCAQSARAVGTELIAASESQVLEILGDLVGALLPSFVDDVWCCAHQPLLKEASGAAGMREWLRTHQLPYLIDRLADAGAEPTIAPPAAPRSQCFQGQAMQLVHDLMSAMPPGQWVRGALIGNEFDLADRFGVDKSVVRQAIRLMEDAEAAISSPGRGLGLVTRLPSTAPLSRLLCAYLVAHGAAVEDGEKTFFALRTECAGAAAENASAEDKITLLSMIHDLEALAAPLPVSAFQGFERLQQHVTHNSLLGMFIDGVKAFLTWRQSPCPMANAEILEAYRKHTSRAAMAICANDVLAAMEAESEKLLAMSHVRNR
ncbi:hypothetical protein [Novosphingobium resinovorum]|uniref:hypothetical protein n=1 Tax=Novosphingobium resinovorum TaxID=158500 RepID=UPI002ED4ADC4|nr:hypothetical protein [Novosphingobium resinovorum]